LSKRQSSYRCCPTISISRRRNSHSSIPGEIRGPHIWRGAGWELSPKL
jgi:hypothetical protein